MKDLKFFVFKHKLLSGRSDKYTRPNHVLYFRPNLANYSVRVFVLNSHRIVDKLGTIQRDFNSNEILFHLDYSKVEYWLKSGIKISFKHYDQALVKLGIPDKYTFK